uniref:C3H1-type domain-containing protein n=1 Tax=Peronospora matthiolae TaxID=2874970 RepID=A0AAV1TD47_9STRA
MNRSSSYAKPCKFFLQGTCRNGNHCRFAHDVSGNRDRTSGSFGVQSSQSMTTQGGTMTEAGRALAIEELRHPPMWPLSGFAVTKGLPSVVTGDVSCEEARWEAYQELKASGSCMQSKQKLQALAAEQQTQRQRILSLLEDYQSAQKLFNGELLPSAGSFGEPSGVSNPFGGGRTANPFGGGAASNSFRGGTAASPFGSTVSSFGSGGSSAAAAPASSPFESHATQAVSPFGGSSSTAFGGAAASPFGSSAAFGAPSAVGTGSGAGFNASPAANPFGGAAATSAFNKPAASTGSPFGTNPTSTFGVAAAASSSPFGGATTAFGDSSAGSSLAGFGGSVAKPAASPFGSSSGTFSVTTPFGGTPGAPTSTTSPFSRSSSAFGSSSGTSTKAADPFGVPASFSTNSSSSLAVPSSSPFGAPALATSANNAAEVPETSPAGASSSFGGSSTHVVDTPLHSAAPSVCGPSPDARDDAWNAEQFQRAEFVLGMIPTVPPPPQFC